MAEFAMWGPQQSGARLAMKDQQDVQGNDLAMLAKLAQIQMMPDQASAYREHARLYGAQADKEINNTRMRGEVSQQMSDLGAGRMEPSERMRLMGTLMLDRGMFEDGRRVLEGAALYDSREANVDARQAAAVRNQLTSKFQLLDQWGKLAGGVTDQQSLDRMLLMGAELASGVEDPTVKGHTLQMLQSIPRTFAEAEPVLQQLRDSTVKEQDKLRNEQREMDLARREREATRRDGDSAIRARLAEVTERLNQARLDAIERNAGRAPKDKDEVEPARDLIRQNLGLSAEEKVPGLDIAATELADNARQLMRRNGALTFSQALAQSYDPRDWEKSAWYSTAKPSYKGPGQAAHKPLPLTATPEVGRWYKDDSGKVMQFEGFGPDGKSKWKGAQ